MNEGDLGFATMTKLERLAKRLYLSAYLLGEQGDSHLAAKARQPVALD